MTRYALLALLLSLPVAAQGVTDTEILLGQSCALKGQAAALGTGMQTGLEVYFGTVNQKGGVHGRKIRLESVNDGYEPDRCSKVVSMLIEQQKVFAIIGGVGTPTAKVAIPVCTEAKVPFFAAFTGAELLRDPFNPYVVNLRASYFQETEALASRASSVRSHAARWSWCPPAPTSGTRSRSPKASTALSPANPRRSCWSVRMHRAPSS
jgi:branched-chain amino acid transport system substrate-binding protein